MTFLIYTIQRFKKLTYCQELLGTIHVNVTPYRMNEIHRPILNDTTH